MAQDKAEATKWIGKAADQGLALAQNTLGERYNNGNGVSQDRGEALKWFRKAAEQGDAEAQNNLGAMYAQGQGVSRDLVRAYAWFNLAAVAGNQRAASNRSIAARHMTVTEFVEAQKLASTNKPPPP